MAKPKIPNQKKKYKELNGRLSRYVALVEQIYDTMNLEAAKAVSRTDYSADSEKPFKWSDYPETRKQMDDIQAQFVDDIRAIIYRGTSEEWKNSNVAQDLIADKVLKAYTAQVDREKYKVLYQTNSDALKAFQKRKDKGLNVSAKLWNQSVGYKRELEEAISCAIQKGTSAVTLSKQISKYLQDFPSLQKDYKERYGTASRAADCEYRSIRLARSEINMAYRTAENERWKQMDFVVGYEIKTSTSHFHRMPKGDICDDLAGKYPKDFAWTGWHPNCLCYKIPILKTEEEFWEWDGRSEVTTESVNEVKDVPDAFKQWIDTNSNRIDEASKHGTLPYFIKDNREKVDAILNKEQKPLTTLEKARYAEAKRLRETGEYYDIAVNPNGYGLKATHKSHNFDKNKGWYEKDVQNIGFNAGHSVILEAELDNIFGKRHTEGTWDGFVFEIASRETATVNNIKRGLEHCADKKTTEIAVLHFPDGGFNPDNFNKALHRYKGLEKLHDGQFRRFKKIICIQSGQIVYEVTM